MSSLLVLLAGAGLMALGAAKWRIAPMIVLVIAVFEGAFRKWIVPDAGQWIYLAKDVILLGACIGFWGPGVLGRGRLSGWHRVNGGVAALGLLAVLELMNPWLPNLLVGLFGIKAYLMYVPLMYMIPACFEDVARVRRFWNRYLMLALIPLILGVVQFALPPSHVLNRYAWEDKRAPGVGVAGFGGTEKPRITGTFSYITGYTSYLTLICLVAVSLGMTEKGKRSRLMLYGVLTLIVANLLMTGSRGPFLMLGAAVPMFFALAWRFRGVGGRRVVVMAGVGLPLVALLTSSLFPEAQGAFVERVQGTDDLSRRLAGMLSGPVSALDEAGLFGYGIGSTHQARRFLMPGEISDRLPPPAENEWERIILEVGPLGFALVLLTRVLVALQLWVAYRASQGSELRTYVATALVFSLISIPTNLVFNHTASAFYWFMAGFGLIRRSSSSPPDPVSPPGARRREYAR
jgi:hypothetical protein